MSKKIIGILTMAYGTPTAVDEIEPYYTHIRRGRPPEKQQLDDLIARYEAIGGLSPLNEITGRQVVGLAMTLAQMEPDVEYRVYIGMKHWHPYIDEAVQQMHADGITEAVGIVWAPHYSSMSVGTYIEYAEKAREKYGGPAKMTYVQDWHMQPNFIASTATRVRAALDEIPEAQRAETPVVFTAHSLPARITQMGDPYPQQIEESARAIANAIGHKNWFTGWQSAGRTPEPWLGPDILDVIKEQAQQGVKSLVICPFGFVSDHLEVLYDVDIEAKQLANELGIQLVRAASPNDEFDFLRAVATAVLEQADKD
ncbi:ferrochelatase [Tumebacillus sp. ITR2]|uniref:Coproporphyrin III ferrochelatase n=1 Tax=Tumebacillus amylolyticus TaxID=2801339 RepID=A0ABS1JAI0_9BACL|nr:ferrochelatase [Tumebacillus amylolyticus]MBL0387291.1 ferrochelatase [Tumebacillus amylolyticus]